MMMTKKSPEQLIEGTKKHGLKKTLSTMDLTMLGIGAIIGAGIFTIAGVAAVGTAITPGAGPGLILSFVIAGIACALAALSYAEFAAMIPVAGSVYTYTFATLGEVFAWTVGWVLAIGYTISCIAVAHGWSGYLMKFIKDITLLPTWLTHPPVWLVNDYFSAAKILSDQGINAAAAIPHIGPIPICLDLPAFAIIAAVTAILIKGTKESTKAATIMVFLKVGVILLFVGLGAFYVKPANWTPFLPNGFEGVLAGTITVFFAYIGFDAISTAAEEAKTPDTSLPIATIASLAVCTLVYITVVAVLTGMVPISQIDIKAPIAAAMSSVGMNWIAGFISIGAIAGLTSVLLVMQLGTSRILFAMSRDKLIPKKLAKIHPEFGTPYLITLVLGGICMVGSLFIDIAQAAQLCSMSILTAFILISFEVLVLRVKRPDLRRPFKVPFAAITCPLAMLACAALIWTTPIQTKIMYLVCLAVGLVIYFSYAKVRKAELENEMIQAHKFSVNELLRSKKADVEEETQVRI
ncbi:MAG TPA: amino acid permease [Cyanobacteria bacterium UBA9579]|nr:amino acid permease [Cyanobacteria bacterium UBA9579]